MERNRKLLNEFDWVIIAIYATLLLFGCLSVYAASFRELEASSFAQVFDIKTSFGKQMMWVAICIVMVTFVLLVDSKFFTSLAYLSYIISILLLVAVLVVGKEIHGNKSWFGIGSFGIQPAEFAKFCTALALAKFLSNQNIEIKNMRNMLTAFAIIGLPAALVLMQPDLGSMLVFCSFVIVLYREGLNPLFLIVPFLLLLFSIVALKFGALVLAILVLVSLSLFIYYNFKKSIRAIMLIVFLHCFVIGYGYSVDFIYNKVMKDYQRARIDYTLRISSKQTINKPLVKEEVVLKPHTGEKKHRKFDDWNIRQSIIAIGSGGLLGKGFLKGKQTKFEFVPEQTTDFIFCTIGEEEGFWGTTLILALYIGLLLRLVWMADRQRSKFSRIYGYSVACILFFHFLINIGMTIGVVPVIGIPLPFISYGGSSLLAFTLLLMIMVKLDADRLHVLR